MVQVEASDDEAGTTLHQAGSAVSIYGRHLLIDDQVVLFACE